MLAEERLAMLMGRLEKELPEAVRKSIVDQVSTLLADMSAEEAVRRYVNPRGRRSHTQHLFYIALRRCGLGKLAEPIPK